MVNKDILMTRIDKLKAYLEFLEAVQKHDRGDYIKDPYIYGSSERFLHLAIECCVDIANHIIADMRYRKPESNRDVFTVLNENGMLDKNLAEHLSNMASFRNILVHDYLKLDRGMVFDFIKSNLGDLQLFAREIVRNF